MRVINAIKQRILHFIHIDEAITVAIKIYKPFYHLNRVLSIVGYIGKIYILIMPHMSYYLHLNCFLRKITSIFLQQNKYASLKDFKQNPTSQPFINLNIKRFT